jgi:hypothetical protein
MRFFSVEVRIVGRLPGPDPLGRQSLSPQKPPHPLIGHRRQKPLRATVLRQLRHGPVREGQTPLRGARQRDLDQLPQLLRSENRRAPSRIGDLLEGLEPALVEATHPVVRHREVAAHPVRRLGDAMTLEHLRNDAVALMHPGRQGRNCDLAAVKRLNCVWLGTQPGVRIAMNPPRLPYAWDLDLHEGEFRSLLEPDLF